MLCEHPCTRAQMAPRLHMRRLVKRGRPDRAANPSHGKVVAASLAESVGFEQSGSPRQLGGDTGGGGVSRRWLVRPPGACAKAHIRIPLGSHALHRLIHGQVFYIQHHHCVLLGAMLPIAIRPIEL